MQNFPNSSPKSKKHRPQPPSQCDVPRKRPSGHSQKHRHAQISSTDPEAYIQPSVENHTKKDQIPKPIAFSSQWLQKTVHQRQLRPHRQRYAGAAECHRRHHHRNSRRRPPPRLSSYTKALIVPSTATCPPSTERFFSCRP